MAFQNCGARGFNGDASTIDWASVYGWDPMFPPDHTIVFVGRTSSFTFYQDLVLNVQFSVSPLDKLQSVTISINGVAQTTLKPEQLSSLNLDFSSLQGTVDVDALATFNDGKFARNRITLELPLNGETAKSDNNCFSSSDYDSCIFYKNPIAQKGAPFSPAISAGTDLSLYQIYGVKLRNLASSTALRNDTFNISVSTGTQANKTQSVDGNSWKLSYANDQAKHFNAQVMAYYWLNQMDEVFTYKMGVFYPHNKSIPIDAYNSSIDNNAYWDGTGILMGFTTIDRSGKSEVALGADVYMHEMGHANLAIASPSTMNFDSNTHTTDQSGNLLCKTAVGCMGAIHEGQADFHAAIMFPENPRIGEHFFNNLDGLPYRNVLANDSVSAAKAYYDNNGEIHGLGSVYASILWMLYTHPQMLKIDFQKMFAEHLTLLTASSTFTTTKGIFLAIDTAKYGGKYQKIITQVYAAKGL